MSSSFPDDVVMENAAEHRSSSEDSYVLCSGSAPYEVLHASDHRMDSGSAPRTPQGGGQLLARQPFAWPRPSPSRARGGAYPVSVLSAASCMQA